MRKQCVPGPLLSFVGPGNEATLKCERLHINNYLVRSHLFCEWFQLQHRLLDTKLSQFTIKHNAETPTDTRGTTDTKDTEALQTLRSPMHHAETPADNKDTADTVTKATYSRRVGRGDFRVAWKPPTLPILLSHTMPLLASFSLTVEQEMLINS